MLDETGQILGYYTLSSYSIRATELPREIAKKLPKYPLIPVTLQGRLAVSQAHQGQKLGTLLLMDAVHRSWKNTREVGSVGVVAESINDAAQKFHLHHEFVPLAEHPRKLFIAMGALSKVFG